MITDIHTHVWAAPQQLGEAIAQRFVSANREPWNRLDAGPVAHQQAMAPVQRAVVHGLVSRYGDANVSLKHVTDATQGHPERLFGFAGIDPLTENVDDQLNEAVERGMVGITICPSGQAMHPCHSRAMHLYDRCEHHGLPVFIHGSELFGAKAVLSLGRPEMLDEIGRTFPNLRVVIAQMGRPWVEPTLLLIRTHAHFYTETSNLVNEPWQLYNALVLAHQYAVMNKILFASGFPLCTPEEAIMNIYAINRFTQGTHLPSVPRQELRSIVERDGLDCLGIKQPGPDVSTNENGSQAPLVREGAA